VNESFAENQGIISSTQFNTANELIVNNIYT